MYLFFFAVLVMGINKKISIHPYKTLQILQRQGKYKEALKLISKLDKKYAEKYSLDQAIYISQLQLELSFLTGDCSKYFGKGGAQIAANRLDHDPLPFIKYATNPENISPILLTDKDFYGLLIFWIKELGTIDDLELYTRWMECITEKLSSIEGTDSSLQELAENSCYLFYSKGMYDKSSQICYEGVVNYTESEDLNNFLAASLVEIGQATKAIKYSKKLLELKKDIRDEKPFGEGLFIRQLDEHGQILVKAGEIEKACGMLNQIITETSSDDLSKPSPLSLARVLLEKKRVKEVSNYLTWIENRTELILQDSWWRGVFRRSVYKTRF